MRIVIALTTVLLLISACGEAEVRETAAAATSTTTNPSSGGDPSTAGNSPASTTRTSERRAGPGESIVVAVPSEGIGNIAVRVTLPSRARYADGAGVVVDVATFFTSGSGFRTSADATDVGLIHVTYLWPGNTDPGGQSSDGRFDFGGPDSIRALSDVIRFATGDATDADGRLLADLISMVPLQVGVYAFSHPGLAAINVLALYGDDLDVRWLVGRENPTEDVTSAVEIGHWDEAGGAPVPNPRYSYPSDYTPTSFDVDFNGARWDADYSDPESPWLGRAYLDLDGDGALGAADFLFGSRIPTMFDKRFHSAALTRALAAGGSLTAATWPDDLATVEEAEATWRFQRSTERYAAVGDANPALMVMLVFADRDHVQPALDKPHIHQAYDGLHDTAGLWVRLNPDSAYIEALSADIVGTPDNPANREPPNWLDSRDWAYSNAQGSDVLVPLAAIAEMADRAHEGVMDDNLDAPLVDF